ncbi:MAG: alpha,alpha-trehalase [Paraglaciecola sp.]|jgi:alpha,alpha-trehalase
MKNTLLAILVISLLSACQNAPEKVKEITTETITTSNFKTPIDVYGDFLVDVQMAEVFPDGKTFVDCTPKRDVTDILADYKKAKMQAEFHLRAFVLENFETPKKYASGFISDTTKSVQEHINSLWPVLTRTPKQAERGTLIPLPKPYIVPGGRFGEIYYWDSYFTMLGLQAAGKAEMIENMVDNFSYLIDEIGFIPNGNRTYFLGRSQPPFYACMVGVLAEMKGDDIYKKYLPQLEKEYNFWMDGADKLSETNRTHKRVVRLSDGFILNRYWDNFDGPREESYREDVETAEKSGRPLKEVYRDLRAGAESGWDYSSRWLRKIDDLSTIHTTDILPADLNSLLYNLEMTIAKGYELSNNADKTAFYNKKAADRKTAILRYHYFAASGLFMDFDFTVGEPTYVPSLATMYPLFFKIATPEQAETVAKNIQESFLRPGGLNSTVHNTGQQWDAPNGWAPLQWISIQGLHNYGQNELANMIQNRWINLNKKVYKNTGKMVEKYNVQDASLEGGGGEYPVQDGFGWSNGVLLRLMKNNME